MTTPPADWESASDRLRQEWTDQYVRVRPDRPELRRFAGVVGRVVTVNRNGNALVDFQDGAWYDIPAAATHLEKLGPAEGKAAHDPKANSAQARPERQG